MSWTMARVCLPVRGMIRSIIDLGAIFDTLNLRDPGVDMLSGFNVHSIALEVPASWLTEDEEGIADTESPVLGAYASTHRRTTTVLRGGDE